MGFEYLNQLFHVRVYSNNSHLNMLPNEICDYTYFLLLIDFIV